MGVAERASRRKAEGQRFVTNRIQRIGVIFSLCVGVSAFASADGWKTFDSSRNFSVSYPADWFRIGASADRLQLLSSKGGAEGITIKHGQAEITAMEAEASPTETLTQVIDRYTEGASVLSRTDLPNVSGKEGCSGLKEIISREQAIPQSDAPIDVPYIVNTDLFCDAEGHKVVILLRNWEGDKGRREYQQIVLRMARSIKALSRK